ncbi:MAG: ABC transporter permease [Atopostipes suicloacalis]|nr:ABC transporter permease [Atopostipes suicloacalis]
MIKLHDKTLLLLSFLGTTAFSLMNFITYKENRISQGTSYSSFQFLAGFAIIILALWLILIGLSFYDKRNKDVLVFSVSVILLIALFWTLQRATGSFIDGNSSARISLSAGFYIQVFSIYMLLSFYSSRNRNYKYAKWIGLITIVSFFVFFFINGAFDDLSLIKEYTIKREQFYENLRMHALLTFGSVLTGAIIAIPLGYLAYMKSKWEGRVMTLLSIIQTIPSLSLFGILLVPLSGLGNLKIFNAIGVSGIGWAPAYVALTLYTLLPIARNTLTGFYSVDKNIIEASRGMGMNKKQILRQIELPLAFPVIFTGVRIAFIQTIGGAVLAGLVGGGGMGTFVFLGLGEASPDLILLGVLPIVFFTSLFDYILRSIEEAVRGVIYD